MNTLRRLLGFFVALLLVAFAGTALAAPIKSYTLNMTPGTLTPGSTPTTQTITATFKNVSPTGNSNTNSFTLGLGASVLPGLTITSAILQGPDTGTVVTAGDHRSVAVTNMNPQKPGDTWVLVLTVSVPAANTCTGVSGSWSATVWTGSSLAGDTFALTPPSSTTTSLTVGCTLRFVPGREPHDALVSAAITNTNNNVPAGVPVEVEVVDSTGARATWVSGPVSLSKTSGSAAGTLSGASATLASGWANFPSLAINQSGDYRLFGVNGSFTSAPSATFSIGDGILNCGDSLQFTNPGNKTVDESGFAEGKRFALNKDGSDCKLVNYTFENTILIDNTVHLKWAVQTQPNAGFTYTATWIDEAVSTTTGMPAHRTRVAWETNPSTGLPRYVPAIACLSQNPPASLGTLTSDIGTVEVSIPITWTTTPTAYPFPIVINTERMTVTGPDTTQSGYYLVVRDSDGIPGTLASGHLNGVAVMSTPLPIDPNHYLQDGTTVNPYWNQQVRMCIWEESWQAVGAGKVRFTTSVFDIGDGWMIGN